jgi:hypothetical protein
MKPKDFDALKISGIYVSILRTRFSVANQIQQMTTGL